MGLLGFYFWVFFSVLINILTWSNASLVDCLCKMGPISISLGRFPKKNSEVAGSVFSFIIPGQELN